MRTFNKGRFKVFICKREELNEEPSRVRYEHRSLAIAEHADYTVFIVSRKEPNLVFARADIFNNGKDYAEVDMKLWTNMEDAAILCLQQAAKYSIEVISDKVKIISKFQNILNLAIEAGYTHDYMYIK